MAYDVKFLQGTQASYDGKKTAGTLDAKTFYLTDTNLYLGEIKLSNAQDIADAVTNIEGVTGKLADLSTTAKGNLVAAINEVFAKAGTNATAIGNISTLSTTDKTNVVAAINELVTKITDLTNASTISIDTSVTTAGAAKSYTVKQGTKTIGTIDIPKDMVVSKGEVKALSQADIDALDASVKADMTPGTYIVLTIANKASDKLYINVGTLVDIYTAEANAAQVQLAINPSTRVISATIKAGSIGTTELTDGAVTTAKIADTNVTTGKLADSAVTTDKIADKNVTKGKLEQAVQDTLNAADSALQKADITTGSANGNIAVEGTDVPVKGLDTAAYKKVEDFDAAGAASTAETNAKTYAEGLLTWGTF